MKNIILIMIMVILVAGCDSTIYEPNPTREKEEEAFAKENEVTEVVTDLIFVDETSISLVALDNDGNSYEVSKAGRKDVGAGMMAKSAVLSYRQGELVDITFESVEKMGEHVLIIEAGSDTYKTEAAKAILRQYKYNSDVTTSIMDYKVIDVSTMSAIEGVEDRIMNVTLTYEVKPHEGAYVWGDVNEEGWTGARNYTFMIYGADSNWLVSSDRIVEPGVQAEKTWLHTATDNQIILYETDTYTYYSEKEYYDDHTEEVPSYKAPIRRLNRATGDIKRMYSGDDNINYLPVYQSGKYLFIETRIISGSELQASYFGVLDVDRNWMEEEVNEASFYGTKLDDLIYIFTLDKLVTLNVTDMKVTEIAKLPLNLSVSSQVMVNYVDEGIMEVVFTNENALVYHFNMEEISFIRQ